MSYLKDLNPLPGLTYRISPQDAMPQVLLPEGEFLMGSPDDEPGRNSDEGPRKTVYVSAFWMDLCEVTVGRFQAFCEAAARGGTSTTLSWGDSFDEAMAVGEIR